MRLPATVPRFEHGGAGRAGGPPAEPDRGSPGSRSDRATTAARQDRCRDRGADRRGGDHHAARRPRALLAARPADHRQHPLRARDPAHDDVREAAPRLLRLPVAAAHRDAVPARPERRVDAPRARAGLRRRGHPRLRPGRRRRLAHHRRGHLPDPRRHPVRGGHEGCRARRRGRRPLHPRRDARQADGDRRGPELRPHHRGRGARAAARTSPRRPTSTARWTARASSSRATRSPAS